MSHLWPTPEQFAALTRRAGEPGAVTMLNLLRYRETAAYADHPDEPACSGKAAYARYAKHAFPCVESAGGRLVFAGAAAESAIGPGTERWDDVLLVEYPSVQAFIDMVNSTAYQAIVHHRLAALADSRLIPLTAGTPAYES